RDQRERVRARGGPVDGPVDGDVGAGGEAAGGVQGAGPVHDDRAGQRESRAVGGDAAVERDRTAGGGADQDRVQEGNGLNINGVLTGGPPDGDLREAVGKGRQRGRGELERARAARDADGRRVR